MISRSFIPTPHIIAITGALRTTVNHSSFHEDALACAMCCSHVAVFCITCIVAWCFACDCSWRLLSQVLASPAIGLMSACHTYDLLLLRQPCTVSVSQIRIPVHTSVNNAAKEGSTPAKAPTPVATETVSITSFIP